MVLYGAWNREINSKRNQRTKTEREKKKMTLLMMMMLFGRPDTLVSHSVPELVKQRTLIVQTMQQYKQRYDQDATTVSQTQGEMKELESAMTRLQGRLEVLDAVLSDTTKGKR